MIDSNTYQCSVSACEPMDPTSSTHDVFYGLQLILGTSPTGTLTAQDLAAYQSVAAHYGLPNYLNVFDLAAHADDVGDTIQRGITATGVIGAPPKWFWGVFAAATLLTGTLVFFGLRGMPAQRRRRRA